MSDEIQQEASDQSGSKITLKELYDHILKHMTAEEALMKLLSAGIIQYNHLKFPEGSTPVHPEILIAMAAMDKGWDIIVESPEKSQVVRGLVIGTREYVEETFKK